VSAGQTDGLFNQQLTDWINN